MVLRDFLVEEEVNGFDLNLLFFIELCIIPFLVLRCVFHEICQQRALQPLRLLVDEAVIIVSASSDGWMLLFLIVPGF